MNFDDVGCIRIPASGWIFIVSLSHVYLQKVLFFRNYLDSNRDKFVNRSTYVGDII